MDRPATGDGRSIVVCCYTSDRWERLSSAIRSSAVQLTGSDELVVVVDHNDNLLKRVEMQFGQVATVVPNRHEPGLSGARNTGVEQASEPIILFLDDDAVPAPTWIEDLTRPFDDPSVVGVGGHAEPDWVGGTAPWWLPDEFYWVVGCSYRGLPEERAPIRNPIGCNMAFRKDVIERADGFSTALGRVKGTPAGAEETDLAIRVRSATGGTILYEPSAVVHHAVDGPRTKMNYFVNRCYSEGRSKAILARRVGAGNATSAERSYLRTLLTGVGTRLKQAIRKADWHPLAQIGVIGIGLTVTGSGFAIGTITATLGGRR
jgi:GT2 family glycosyltransferase